MEHIHSERAAPAFALEPLVPNALEPIHDKSFDFYQSICARQEPHLPKAGSALDLFALYRQGQHEMHSLQHASQEDQTR